MENQKMSAISGSASDGKKTITILLILIIGIAVGFTAGRYSKSGSKSSSSKTADSNCEAKLEKVKTMLPSVSETKFIFGKIKEIKNDAIMLEAASINPLETSPSIRTVTIKDGAKFIKSEFKDNAVFQKEMDEYQKTAAAQTDKTQILAPPTPFTEKEITFSDLKVDDQISVEASENIEDKDSFEAVKITLQVMPEIPIPASGAPSTNAIPAVPLTVPELDK
jgi:hypothetical protein